MWLQRRHKETESSTQGPCLHAIAITLPNKFRPPNTTDANISTHLLGLLRHNSLLTPHSLHHSASFRRALFPRGVLASDNITPFYWVKRLRRQNYLLMQLARIKADLTVLIAAYYIIVVSVSAW